jgi:nitrogen regulatory protein PII
MSGLTQSTRLTLRFDGEAFIDHEMDAEQVANAIKGMAVSVKHADKLLNGEDSHVEVKVVAFQDGCFGTVLDIIQTSVPAKNALVLLGLLASVPAAQGTKEGVLKYINMFKNRKPKEEVKTNDTVKFTLQDDAVIEVNNDIALLLTDKIIRKNLADIFHDPLTHSGVDSVTVGLTVEGKNAAEAIPQAVVTQEEHTSFKAHNKINVVTKEVKDVVKNVYFTKINFNNKNGWAAKFPDGNTLNVRMDDKLFLSRAKQNGEKFSSDMLFVVKFEHTKTTSLDESSERYVVKHVQRHRASSENKLIPDS